MMCLGGGGYTIRNVSRAWAYETGICVGRQLDTASPHLPYNEYMEVRQILSEEAQAQADLPPPGCSTLAQSTSSTFRPITWTTGTRKSTSTMLGELHSC